MNTKYEKSLSFDLFLYLLKKTIDHGQSENDQAW